MKELLNSKNKKKINNRPQIVQMKRHWRVFVVLFLILAACSTKQKERPASAIETGRYFIQSILDQSFDDGKDLLLPGIANLRSFELMKSKQKNVAIKAKNASVNYIIHTFEEINDSIATITYSFEGSKQSENITLLKRNGIWFVEIDHPSPNSL